MAESTTLKRQVMAWFAVSFLLWFIYVSTSLILASNDIEKMNKRIKILEDLLAQKATT